MTASTHLGRYSYKPLPKGRCIRVLELQPSRHGSQPLEGKLRTTDLDDDDSPYEALSYTWGSAELSSSLIIHGQTGSDILRITPNLSEALIRFRHTHDIRTIWADAVCINQIDEAEKNVQIPLMRDIYRSASQVLVWLGDWSEEAKMLRLLERKSARVGREVGGLTKEDRSASAGALDRLLRLSWFSRRWVIQEVALNPDVHIFCGRSSISWLRFAKLVQEIGTKELEEYRAAESVILILKLWKAWVLGEGKGKCTLFKLLNTFDHFGCADGRDRIFALISLSDDVKARERPPSTTKIDCPPELLVSTKDDRWLERFHERDSRSTSTIPPHWSWIRIDVDYTLTKEEVYIQFAREAAWFYDIAWVFEEAGARRGPARSKKLPSWVPDWSVPRRYHALPKTKFVRPSGSRTQDALDWRPLSDVAVWTPNRGTVHHFGIYLDYLWADDCTQNFMPVVVEGMSTPFPADPDHDMIISWIESNNLEDTELWLLTANGSFINHLRPRPKRILESFIKTLKRKSQPGEHQTPGRPISLLDEMCYSHVDSHGQIRFTSVEDWSPYWAKSFVEKFLNAGADQDELQAAFLDLVGLTMRGRRLIKVSRDDDPMIHPDLATSIGIAPADVEIGDRIMCLPCEEDRNDADHPRKTRGVKDSQWHKMYAVRGGHCHGVTQYDDADGTWKGAPCIRCSCHLNPSQQAASADCVRQKACVEYPPIKIIGDCFFDPALWNSFRFLPLIVPVRTYISESQYTKIVLQ